jgi:hypothetical protein
MAFPPKLMLDQLSADGVDMQALRERYERLFPRQLDPVTPNDLLWFARFVVNRRKYLRALDAVERRGSIAREDSQS